MAVLVAGLVKCIIGEIKCIMIADGQWVPGIINLGKGFYFVTDITLQITR